MRKIGEGVLMSKTTNTTNNATINNAKVDFFQSSRTLATRTSEFFRVVIKRAELNTIYSEKISANETSISAIDDILKNGSKLDVSEEELKKMRENYVTINEGLKIEWDKLLAEQATFEYTANDKKFKKAMKNASSIEDVKNAIRDFFKEYKLTVDNTTFETAILESIGKKVTVRTLVKSNGTKALSYDVTNALKNLYGVSFEWMVEAGTIKPANIPSVLQKKYEKKSNKKNK